jgi:hypothetical protein
MVLQQLIIEAAAEHRCPQMDLTVVQADQVL